MKINSVRKLRNSVLITNLLLLSIVILSPFVTLGQFFSYAKAFNTTSPNNNAPVDAKSDNFGNLYTAGNFYGTIDIDPGPGTFNLVSVQWTDFYVAKLDSAGNFICGFSIGTTDNQTLRGFEFDQSGNLVTYGTFKGTVDFDPGPNVFNLIAGGGIGNGISSFIAKYDTACNLIMAKQFNSPGFGLDVIPHALIVDNNDDIIMMGQFNGSVDFDPDTTTNIVYTIDENTFVLKLDANGAFIWVKQFGNAGSSIVCSKAVFDGAQSVYISGSFSGKTDFNPDAAFYFIDDGSIFYEGFILKINTDGEFVWARNIGSPLDNDNANGVTVDPAFSGIYISGSFKSTVVMDSLTSVVLNSVGGYDNYLLKLDTAGNFQWVKSFGNSQDDHMFHLASDQYGLYASGQFKDTLDFYSAFGGSILASPSFYKSFVCKFTHTGIPVWIYHFQNNTGSVGISSIHVDIHGDIYSSGTFETTTDFDPGPLNYNLTALTGYDIFVHKTGMLNPTGVVDFEKQSATLLFPNPAHRKITVKLDQEYSEIFLNLFNSAGQSVQAFQFNSKREIDLNLTLVPGIYFVEIKTSKGNLGVQKIIVQ